MSGRRKRKRATRRTNKNDTFSEIILRQKDMVKMILSYLCQNELQPDRQFDDPVMNASMLIKELARSPDQFYAFRVLPIRFRFINKLFNECVNELSHLIFSMNNKLDITKLSIFPNCRYLKQLYLIQCFIQLNTEQATTTVNALNNLNFPCLEILQIDYCHSGHWWDLKKDRTINIDLSMENLPCLEI